ncbi:MULTISPECIES: HAD family hydrolase [Halorussus]|uniref:HAD family hydrolase n=1 Tax=Halorussus TaxID=1070314 RepID=UPI000E211C41|nr:MULTISPECIES: HAD hydrolase-like protein [Halorussus]NHN60115.1 HAD family hydrolase [Halorussus sp. JP-T4]
MTSQTDRRIVFDLDGTLLDTSHRHHYLYCTLLDSLGSGIEPLPKSRFWCRKRSGKSTMDLIRDDLSESEREKFSNNWIDKIESQEYLSYDSLIPGTRPALEHLEDEFDLYLLTRRTNSANARRQVADFDLKQYFRRILVVSHDGPEKSQVLTEEFSHFTTADIVIGDTGEDIRSGNAVGATTVGVLSGIRNRSRLEQAEPNQLIAAVHQFPYHLSEVTH